MDARDVLLLHVFQALQDAGASVEKLQIAKPKILEEFGKYEISERQTEIAIRETESQKFIQLYLASIKMEGKSACTVKLYVRILLRFMQSASKPLKEINAFDVRVWLAAMQQQISMRSCENYRSYLNAFYTWMANEGFISNNPLAKIDPVKYVDGIKLPFSDVEVDKIRSACTSLRERAVVEVLLSSGVRVSELVGLDRSDIDFHSMAVIVRNGKGGKSRTSYIGDVARSHLQSYLSSRSDDCACAFLSRQHTRLSRGSVERMLKIIGDRAGVPNVHPHRFRRTFATNMSKRGMDLSTLQLLMGHSNTNTTMCYVALSQDNVKNQYNRYQCN